MARCNVRIQEEPSTREGEAWVRSPPGLLSEGRGGGRGEAQLPAAFHRLVHFPRVVRNQTLILRQVRQLAHIEDLASLKQQQAVSARVGSEK